MVPLVQEGVSKAPWYRKVCETCEGGYCLRPVYVTGL